MPLPHRPDYLAVFDLETDGVDVFGAHIVTAFVGLMNWEGQMIERRSWFIDFGGEIPEGASAVNGITTEKMRAEGRKDAGNAIFEIAQQLNIYDRKGYAVVIYNAPFDLTLLGTEMERHFPGAKYTAPTFVVDPLVIDKALDPWRKGSRKLVDVAPLYGVESRADAHDAEADCIMAGQVAIAQLNHKTKPHVDYPMIGQPIGMIHRRQVSSKRKQATSFREFLEKKLASGFDKKLGRKMTDEELVELRASIPGVRDEWPIIPRTENGVTA